MILLMDRAVSISPGISPICALLRERVEQAPERVGMRFVGEDGFVEVTRAQQWARMLRIAGGLRDAGVAPGEHVLILAPDVRVAVEVVFGVWAAGAVPVQVGLPYRMADVGAFVAGLRELAATVGARKLVVSRMLAPFAPKGDEVLIAEQLDGELDEPRDAPGPAFLQLTSGSVSHSRAVTISHDHLLAHLAAIAARLPGRGDDSGVSWLPLYHDMGLVGGLLYPFYCDFPVALLSPLEFRSKPYLWLQALSRLGATHTMGPPSAFALVTQFGPRAVQDKLDLSRLRCAMTGAEPILPRVLRGFSEAFAACGFRAEAWFPVYGLAEATVAVTFPNVLAPTCFDSVDHAALARGRAQPGNNVEFVGVGTPLPGVEIRVVSSTGRIQPEREIGEILVKTSHGMSGYWNDSKATAKAYWREWLRTGDLGYVADGELFVTGRRKELIIRAGRNLIPTVIEDIVGQIEGVRAGCVCAVGVFHPGRGTERAVVVAESKLPPDEQPGLVRRIIEALERDGIDVDEVKLVEPGWLPKTTSGKLRRTAVVERLT
jgi:acyl-CoA synthetase (AMP-forming)/AMP-acid ligase II